MHVACTLTAACQQAGSRAGLTAAPGNGVKTPKRCHTTQALTTRQVHVQHVAKAHEVLLHIRFRGVLGQLAHKNAGACTHVGDVWWVRRRRGQRNMTHASQCNMTYASQRKQRCGPTSHSTEGPRTCTRRGRAQAAAAAAPRAHAAGAGGRQRASQPAAVHARLACRRGQQAGQVAL